MTTQDGTLCPRTSGQTFEKYGPMNADMLYQGASMHLQAETLPRIICLMLWASVVVRLLSLQQTTSGNLWRSHP